jgi:DNA-binding transcriptional MocR family regulator
VCPIARLTIHMNPPVPKYRWIADQLIRSIQMGHYTIGDKLPTQRQLASQYGVSIGIITHAYAELEKGGWVTARVGDGTYVNCTETHFAPHASINLALNVPTFVPETVTSLQTVLASIAADAQTCREMLEYPSEFGVSRHRDAIAAWLQRLGMQGPGHRIMITSGAQHALACVLRTMTRPGDVLLTECLSYHGLRPLEHELRLHVVGVASDEQGLLPDALERAARTHKAKILFCIPSLQMPTVSNMSMDRREQIAQVAQRNKLLVIEDCVSALGQVSPLPALSSWLPDQSFLIGSFSKTTSPALRVGFIESHPKWLGKIALALRADTLSVTSLLPEVIVRWMENGSLTGLIHGQQRVMHERQQVASRQIEAFNEHRGLALTFRSAPDFPFLWLNLPAGLRATEVSSRLQTKGVLVRPSDHFRMGRMPAPQALRISLSLPENLGEMVFGLDMILETLYGAV